MLASERERMRTRQDVREYMPLNEGARKQRVNNAIQQFHVTRISHTATTKFTDGTILDGIPSNTDKGLCYYALLHILCCVETKLGLICGHLETR